MDICCQGKNCLGSMVTWQWSSDQCYYWEFLRRNDR